MGLDIFHYVPSDKIELDYFLSEDIAINPDFLNKYIHLLKITEDGYEVLYVRQIGYKRKGMHGGFYDNFVNSRPYFNIESIILARTFVRPNSAYCFDEFDENFVNNFKDGSSIFEANW
jgi:hypothetical protein